MRIAYVLDEDISINSGVVQKIRTKTGIWTKNGHSVIIISLRSGKLDSLLPNSTVVSLREEVSLVLKFYRHWRNIRRLGELLAEFNPDIIYCRHIKFSPRLVRTLKKRAKYVIEVNTNDRKEFMLINPRVGIYNRLTRSFLYKSSSGLVAVTHELAEDPDFTRFGKPTITIANGVLGIHTEIAGKKRDGRFMLAFIGTPGHPWHGLDKVIFLAEKSPDFMFLIAGSNREDIMRIGNTDKVPTNIEAFGYLDKAKALKLLSQCDVGISSLAMDRAGLNEGSPLKTREYMLLGLPVVIGYKDTDLSEVKPFILNLGAGDNNVRDNLEAIHSFVLNSRKQDPESIRQYAKKQFNFEEKEQKRLGFLKEIAGNA